MKTKKIISVLLAIIMTLGLSTVFVTAADTVTPDYSIANINKAPKMDGAVYYSEYGAPIITATQADTSGTGKIKFIQGSGVANANQKALIYMTADENYLYVAAKLDNAQQNGFTTTSAYCPQLCVTLAEYDSETNSVPLANNVETYRAFRLLYEKNATTAKVWSKLYIGSSTSQPAIAAETSGQTYFTKYESGTYTYEMRIAWDTVPGMSGQDYKNGKPFAMTIRLNDAINTGSTACYYQIGGGASGGTIAGAKPHSNYGYMVVAGGEWCYQNNTLAAMPTEAPEVDNNVGEDEYGDPILVTSPQHVYTITNSSYKRTGVVPRTQRAKVYMTNDENNLYIAGTLDHAQANSSTITTAGRGAQMLVTLSRYDENTTNKIHQVNNCDNYLLARFGFTADSTSGATYLKIFTDKADGTGTTSTNPVGLTVKGAYNENVYTYEMCIPWSQIPGMEDGVYNGEALAATIRFLDGCDAQYDNHYNIGGDAGASITLANIHDGGVLKLTVNDQSTKAAAKIGDINYGSLERAMSVAKSNDTIALIKDVAMDEVQIKNGVTLDLKGYALTASTVIANVGIGQIVDSSIGEGIIKMAKNTKDAAHLLLTKDHGTLPLYDAQEGGYRFYVPTFEKQERETNDTNKRIYGIRVGLPTEKAYDLLDDADNYTTLSIKLVLTKAGNEKPTTIDHAFMQTTVETYVSESLKDLSKKKGIMLTVTGFDAAAAAGITVTATASMAMADAAVENVY